MEDKRIEAVRDWPEYHLVPDIQVFLRFANTLVSFQGFNPIIAPLTPILPTTSGLTSNKLIPADGIDEDDGGKVIVEAINKGSGIGFFNPKAM